LHFSCQDTEAQRLNVQLAELAAEFALPGAAEAPVLRWLARAVVWRLARASEQGQREGGDAKAHQALFTRFLLLVEQHFLEHWPMERYASRLGLSTQRLNRLVRAERAQYRAGAGARAPDPRGLPTPGLYRCACGQPGAGTGL
jgi:AraC family transcriptional regulator, transcriptional activator of pobA